MYVYAVCVVDDPDEEVRGVALDIYDDSASFLIFCILQRLLGILDQTGDDLLKLVGVVFAQRAHASCHAYFYIDRALAGEEHADRIADRIAYIKILNPALYFVKIFKRIHRLAHIIDIG